MTRRGWVNIPAPYLPFRVEEKLANKYRELLQAVLTPQQELELRFPKV